MTGIPNHFPPGEGPEKAVDIYLSTKYLTFATNSRLEADFGQPVEVLFYTIASANDEEDRDPFKWTFQGSNDGINWVTLDTRDKVNFPERLQTLPFQIANPAAYRYYALDAMNTALLIIQYAELTFFVNDP